jgi:bifunctional non-homologous end joining protein LigD
MVLAEYRRKRHFGRTPEPSGKATKRRSTRQLQFVVQKHAARRLHYDFRLELDGVLVSWAVPKGPSLDPGQKRLAVHVEDHPLDYADFEGQIAKGEYGGGEVILWDRGTWTPEGNPHEDLARGRLEFHLAGEKLNGGWLLLRMKDGRGRGKDNWLLIKRRDEAARPEREYDVTLQQPASVKSGRQLDGANNGRPAPSVAKNREPRASKPGALQVADFPVQLASLVDEAPQGRQWIHEIKFDGYRMLAIVHRQSAKLYTRNELDWTSRYPTVAKAAGHLRVHSAVLDGELVALDDAGVSRFQLLQNAADGDPSHLVYYAFDLLHLDGEDLRELPLAIRKERLAKIVGTSADGPIRYSDHFANRGPEFLQECCSRGLEGIVSKRADRPYVAGRTRDWLKVKCAAREELVIGGFTDATAAGREFGALLLGYFHGGRLVYAGRVGTGFDVATLRALKRRLDKLRQPTSPFATLPSRERGTGLHWVRPQLVAQIALGSWTDAGILRHASYQGLREDKPASEVGPPESLAVLLQKEQPMRQTAKPNSIATGTPRPAATLSRRKRAQVRSGAQANQPAPPLTHPERVLFPDVGLTKRELAEYYTTIADRILPHVAGRPLSLLRCPEGVGEPCFFQKHAVTGTPEALRRVKVQERDKVEEYLVVDDAAGLVALAQMSVLEIHPWGSTADQLEQPNRLIFDLDPGPDVEWKAIVDAALLLRETLGHLELKTFVKTSGGKGLHVVAPLSGETTWATLKNFARAVAEHIAQQQPELYTAKMAKAVRKARVFIDYLRNDRGATAVAPYSPRARAGAPISMPLAWDELSGKAPDGAFTVASMRQRLARSSRDPWKGFLALRQQLPKFAVD